MALFLAMATAFFAPPMAHSQDYGGEIVIGYKDAPETLNPLATNSAVGASIVQVIFDGLVTITPSWKVLPSLAESWDVSDDKLVWTFHLRKDARFHDGHGLTAEDVVFTYSHARGSSLEMQFLFQNVKNVRAIDDFTVEFRLKEPKRLFLMGVFYIGVLPAHLFSGAPEKDDAFNRRPIGTGIFKFDSWGRDGTILLAANEDYFEGRPYLDRVRMVHISDTGEMWRKLQLGEIDLSYSDILPLDASFLEGHRNLNIHAVSDYMNYMVSFNFKKKIFQDARMRRALSLAADRKMIIDKALLGRAVESAGIFLPSPEGEPDKNEYDPEMSIRLLEEMGYQDADGDGILEKKGKKLSFEVLIDEGNKIKEEAFLILQTQLLEIGVELKAKEMSGQEILMRCITGNYELMFGSGLAALDVPAFLWHSQTAGSFGNLSHYANKELDKLLERLTSLEGGGEQRKELIEQINEEVRRDAAGIFLFSKFLILVINNKFEGIDVNADRFPAEFTSWVYIPRSKQ